MIDNKHIYEIDPGKIDLDLDYLCDLVLRNQGNNKLRFDVNEDPYTKLLYEKYPCLSSVINFYHMPPNWSLERHVDSNRQCALNIPVQNTKNTDTIFFDFAEEPILEHSLRLKLYFIKSKVTETFRFSMTTPVLINNLIPHEVVNATENARISISWSMKPEFTFEQTKAIFIASYKK